MHYLAKSNLTKDETKAFKGRCLTPQNFNCVEFKDGDIVDGEEYYVNKAVKAGAKAGKVIESQATKDAKAKADSEKKAKAAAEKKRKAEEEDAKKQAEEDAKK